MDSVFEAEGYLTHEAVENAWVVFREDDLSVEIMSGKPEDLDNMPPDMIPMRLEPIWLDHVNVIMSVGHRKVLD